MGMALRGVVSGLGWEEGEGIRSSAMTSSRERVCWEENPVGESKSQQGGKWSLSFCEEDMEEGGGGSGDLLNENGNSNSMFPSCPASKSVFHPDFNSPAPSSRISS